MTTLEMNTKKAEIVQNIMNNVDTEEGLEAISDLLDRLSQFRRPPCRYTVEELNERAQRAIRDYEAGVRMIPHENIKRKIFQ